MRRKLAGVRGVCTFVLVLGLAAFAAAQAPANATGTWELVTETSSVGPILGMLGQTLTLKQDRAGKLTGTLGDHKVTGSVKGDKIEFTVSFKDRSGHTVVEKYTGTISGNSMKSTGRSMKWTATRKK